MLINRNSHHLSYTFVKHFFQRVIDLLYIILYNIKKWKIILSEGYK